MRKIFAVFAIFCVMFLMIGCGSSSSSDNNSAANMGKLGKECYPNETCDKGLLCDTDNNVCVEDPENPINDSDKTDSGSDVEPDTGSDSDDSDSAPDNGDTTPDGGDTAPDNGDTSDDSDDSDTGTNPATNLPECSPTGATPCTDAETDLIWSGKSSEKMHWADAVNYCKDLNEGGFNDWRLPSRDVLRSLVQNCDTSSGCTGDSDGTYSKFGDIVFLWSSTGGSSEEATGIYFFNGADQSKRVYESFNARCVRNLKCDMALFEPLLKKCVDPCGPEPCDSLTAIDATCVAFTYEKYSCVGKDPSSGLTWSAKALNTMNWETASLYCKNLTESGYSDWKFPTISELRTLIQNCPGSQTGGACAVSDPDHLASSNWSDDCYCEYKENNGGYYSKLGDDNTVYLLSSSVLSDDSMRAWLVHFYNGSVSGNDRKNNRYYVRCVR